MTLDPAMPDAREPIGFYFDFISPFGYFASLRIDEIAARYGRTVDWTSMLLGVSVLKVMNIPPIVDLPLKGAYIKRDARRYARQHAVPFERPEGLAPSAPLEAGRLFAWAKELDAGRAKALAAGIYQRYFAAAEDIADLEVLARCAEAAGFDWNAYGRDRAEGIPARLLRRNVERSLAQGVFGSPMFIVDGEPFFGVEKLPVLEQWLASGGW